MKAYKLTPSHTADPRVIIEATHARKLPGIRCERCGTWAATGVSYPTIDLDLFDKYVGQLDQRPVSVQEFARLLDCAQPAVGTDRLLLPGTDLGPLIGNCLAYCQGVVWVNSWTMVLSESIWERGVDSGLNLVGAPASLQSRHVNQDRVFEPEARVSARLVDQRVDDACNVCGRRPVRRPGKVVIDSATFDGSFAVQRCRDLPTLLIANEEFAEFLLQWTPAQVRLLPLTLE